MTTSDQNFRMNSFWLTRELDKFRGKNFLQIYPTRI